MVARSLVAVSCLIFAGDPIASAAPPEGLGKIPVILAVAGAPSPLEGILRAGPSPAGAPSAEAREWRVEVPGSLEVELASEVPWRLSLEVAGYWAREAIVPAGNRDGVVLRLLPTGTVGGRVAAGSPGEELPAAIELRFESAVAPGGAAEVPLSTVICPVVGERWECQVPARILDLRLAAEGFIPLYFWDVAVPAGGGRRLGQWVLTHGASLIGWLQTAEGPVPEGANPRVELLPQTSAGVSSALSAEQIRRRGLEAAVQRKGFFQFEGLPPGSYVLIARSDGFAEARVAPVTIFEAVENELHGPVVLVRPIELTVYLDPPLAASGEPWTVELKRLDTRARVRYSMGSGSASLAGRWSQAGLAEGWYSLDVLDQSGSRWLKKQIEVTAGQPPVYLDLDLVPVAGHISLADEPLATTIRFVDRRRGESIRLASDEAGEFAGYLPHEGEWSVEILDSEDQPPQTLDPIEVRRRAGGRPAWLEIRLPDTRLTGTVRDERGNPVAGAQVIMVSGELGGEGEKRVAAQPLTDGEGGFALRGLPPGPLILHARKGSLSSDMVVHTVAEGREGPPLQLVLRPKRELTGRVVSPAGPVAGALVIALGEVGGEPEALTSKTVSDGAGSFALALDQGAYWRSLLVLPPGFSIKLRPIPAAPGDQQTLLLEVGQDGGTLVFDLEAGEAGSRWAARLLHDGAAATLAQLLRGAGVVPDDASHFTIPGLAPGRYTLCSARAGTVAGCEGGYLAPGGELRLRLKPGSRTSEPAGDPD